jgi:cell division protein FtsA
MPELAEEVLGMPVRRGSPMGVGGLVDVVRTPQYATGVGLVQYGVKNLGVMHFQRGDADKRNVWQRMRGWFGEVF